jgi:hypothetical protein
MKKSLPALSLCLLSLWFHAQTAVKLLINHKLNGQPFLSTMTATNDIGNTFNVARMQYYMSKITVIHDGGQQTDATGLYVLVDAKNSTVIDLGIMANISTIEGISFAIGVNTPQNHQDPAGWPATHPLSPKNPSMHWGWTSGYFFIAMSGDAGIAINQAYEIHALDDSNYFTQTHTLIATQQGTDLIIALDAEYAEGLRSINVNSGLVSHGATGACATICTNFRDLVFSAAVAPNTTGIPENDPDLRPFVFPNPTANGSFRINATRLPEGIQSLRITDITGRTILSQEFRNLDDQEFEIDQRGVYLIQLESRSGRIYSQKLVTL